MTKIIVVPTAKEYLKNSETYEEEYTNISLHDAEQRMIEFAKLHVELALKIAYTNAELKEEEKGDEQICFMCSDMGDCFVLDKNSILNSYDLNNIK